jgi:hypothetical protein
VVCQEPGRQQLGKGLGVGLVGLLASLADPMYGLGLASATRATRRRKIAATARALPVASNTTWSSAARLSARGPAPPALSGSARPIGPAHARGPRPRRGHGARPTRSTASSSLPPRHTGAEAGKATLTIRTRSTPGQPQGPPDTTRGLTAHRNGRPALPPLSQALSRNRRPLRRSHPPGQRLTHIFMPYNTQRAHPGR